MINLKTMTIEKAQTHFRNGDFSARELTQAYIDEIQKKNKDIFAYLEVFDNALKDADKADEMIKSGNIKPLTGIPVALKDNMLVEGEICSAGSKILENYNSTYDGTMAKILKNHGAVILGRTNMDEFAMGSSTENSAYGVTKNPYDLSTVAGGSSGGSTSAVAGDMALLSLGSDTGGSIRQPASFCGVVGFKPTYGVVSRSGIIPMGNSLDQIGPIAKNVSDAEIFFNAIKIHDPLDAQSIPEEKRIFENKKVKKIGVPWHLFKEGVDPEVLENFKNSIEKFKNAGYEIIDIDLSKAQHSLAVYYVIMPAEVSTNLSRFDGIRYGVSAPGKDLSEVYNKSRGAGFGKETRRRILLGTYILSHGHFDSYYSKALAVSEAIKDEFRKVFESVDVIVTPTSPTPAFKIGAKSDPLSMYLADIFTVPANIAGIPAISIPNGFTKNGLPLDIQFMAPHFADSLLFTLGKEFEKM